MPLELGPEISGQIKSALLGKPVDDVEVTVMTMTGGYLNTTRTDREGRFSLPTAELPDSTVFVVSAIPSRGITRMELLLDHEVFPKKTLPALPFVPTDKRQLEQYADKSGQQFPLDDNMRVTQLTAAVITAEQKTLRKSQLYAKPDIYISEEELDIANATSIFDLLSKMGVQVSRGVDGGFMMYIRGGNISLLDRTNTDDPQFSLPLLLIDDVPSDMKYIEMISIRDIAQIDVLKSAINTAMFGLRGSNGVISIHTKMGRSSNYNTSSPLHTKAIIPLGYQQPVAFYAPKYEVEAQRNTLTPDIRTTIHWQPVVEIDKAGMASFEFYTADDATSYTVTIEGLSHGGTIIRHVGKIYLTPTF